MAVWAYPHRIEPSYLRLVPEVQRPTACVGASSPHNLFRGTVTWRSIRIGWSPISGIHGVPTTTGLTVPPPGGPIKATYWGLTTHKKL
ncbi:hypothetical protein FKM82_023698 [Ascaphus truei]